MIKFLPFHKSGVQFKAMLQTAQGLEVQAECATEKGSCPDCGKSSSSIHSSYERKLRDLPVWRFPTTVILKVRKFFCRNDECSKNIFAERFPAFTQPYQRRTSRLENKMQRVSVEIGGEGGARLLQTFGINCSADTLLRITKNSDDPTYPEPKVIGIDDFAFRKGHTYGTIIVDLERHKIIDMLPDRTADSLKAWLKDHPSIQFISRDRAGAYASGSKTGAAQARQVADRFHLLKNFSETLEKMVKGQAAKIRKIFESLLPPEQPQASASPTNPAPSTKVGPEPTPARERREEKRQKIKNLISQGYSIRAVARDLNVTRNTVKRYLNKGHIPTYARGKESGKTNPDRHFEYLKLRWNQGCQNATQLLKELRDQGYKGSAQTLRRYFHPWQGTGLVERSKGRKPKMLSTWRITRLLRDWSVAMSPLENRLIPKPWNKSRCWQKLQDWQGSSPYYSKESVANYFQHGFKRWLVLNASP